MCIAVYDSSVDLGLANELLKSTQGAAGWITLYSVLVYSEYLFTRPGKRTDRLGFGIFAAGALPDLYVHSSLVRVREPSGCPFCLRPRFYTSGEHQINSRRLQ